MTPARNRLIAIVTVGLAGLALQACQPATPGAVSDSGPSTGQALIGGPFQLVDQDGRSVDQRVLDGRWSAVYFGYTYCPDVCPTTLQALAQAKARLGPAAAALQVVFVSVDPKRDTPAQLKSYLSAPIFPQPTLGLTGSPDAVAAAAKAYRVYYQAQGTGDAYTVNHSSVIYLMNPHGRFDRVLSASQTPQAMATQIAAAMRAGPGAAT
jgi:protein SCO1/2